MRGRGGPGWDTLGVLGSTLWGSSRHPAGVPGTALAAGPCGDTAPGIGGSPVTSLNPPGLGWPCPGQG